MYGRWAAVEAKTWGHYVPRGRRKRVFVPANGSVGPLAWQSRFVSLTEVNTHILVPCACHMTPENFTMAPIDVIHCLPLI